MFLPNGILEVRWYSGHDLGHWEVIEQCSVDERLSQFFSGIWDITRRIQRLQNVHSLHEIWPDSSTVCSDIWIRIQHQCDLGLWKADTIPAFGLSLSLNLSGQRSVMTWQEHFYYCAPSSSAIRLTQILLSKRNADDIRSHSPISNVTFRHA